MEWKTSIRIDEINKEGITMTTLGLLVIGVIIAFVIKIFFFPARNHLEKAYHSYLTALEQLKKDPSNTALRDEVVALGREYIIVTQHHPEIKPVSESDLMNDIRAASGR